MSSADVQPQPVADGEIDEMAFWEQMGDALALTDENIKVGTEWSPDSSSGIERSSNGNNTMDCLLLDGRSREAIQIHDTHGRVQGIECQVSPLGLDDTTIKTKIVQGDSDFQMGQSKETEVKIADHPKLSWMSSVIHESEIKQESSPSYNTGIFRNALIAKPCDLRVNPMQVSWLVRQAISAKTDRVKIERMECTLDDLPEKCDGTEKCQPITTSNHSRLSCKYSKQAGRLHELSDNSGIEEVGSLQKSKTHQSDQIIQSEPAKYNEIHPSQTESEQDVPSEQNDIIDRSRMTLPKKNGKTRSERESVHHICTLCIKTFKRTKSFLKHMEVKHSQPQEQKGKQKYVDSTGEKISSEGPSPTTSGPMHENLFTCRLCDKTFQKKLEWSRHDCRDGQFDGIKYKCSICGQRFGCRKVLQSHFGTHSEEKPHQCSVCDQECANESTLNAHLFNIHEISVKACYRYFICEKCGKRLKQKGEYNRHMKQHAAEEGKIPHPFQCKICERVCASLGSLRYHMGVKHGQGRAHLPHDKYICSTCGYKTRDRGALERHLMTHTGEKPHHCSECGHGFAQKSSLNAHMFNVHEISVKECYRYYICDKCGMKLKGKGNLKYHMSIKHGQDQAKSPISKITCSHCNKEFANNSNLGRHINICHGEKQFQCTICDRQFSCGEKLKVHSKIHTDTKK